MSLEIKLKIPGQFSSNQRHKHKLSLSNIISLKTSTATNKSSIDPNSNIYSVHNCRDDLHQAEVKKLNKNLKLFLQKEKEKRNDAVNNIHRETMRQSFQKKFYYTENNSISIHKNISKEEVVTSISNPLGDEILDRKKNEKILSRNFSKNLSNNIFDLFTQSHSNTPQDLIKHIKNIRLSKFLIMTNQESATRLKEARDNEVEKLNEAISGHRSKMKLLSETVEKLNKFMIYVRTMKDKEKDRLDYFQNLKNKLDGEIKKIETKTGKIKLHVEKLKEYRNFLICVKEKVRWLPDCFYTAPEEKIINNKKRTMRIVEGKFFNGSSWRSKIKNSFEGSENINSYSNLNSFLGKSFSSKNRNPSLGEKYHEAIKSINMAKENHSEPDSVSISIKPNLIHHDLRFEKYNSLNIKDNLFKSTSEFFEELKSLENKNIILIHKNNNLIETYNKMKKKNSLFNLERSGVPFRDETDELNAIEVRENILEKLKNQNHNLKDIIKNLIQSHDENDLSKSKGKNINKNLKHISKIFAIFDLLNSHLPKLMHNIDTIYTSDQEELTLSKLKLVERAINFLFDKYIFYKRSNTHKKHLKVLENEIEKERKIKKSNQLLLLEEYRIKKLKNKMKRKNKILVVSRKTAMRFEPFKNPKKSSNPAVSKGEDEFEQLVSF